MTALACAIYTRKSSEEGLDQTFNSLDAQREACEAYILSQKTQGWRAIPARYDDGGFSGGNVQRPALARLLADVAGRRVQIIVVYKVDRLTRSLADFAKLVELFDAQGVSFVSVTQQFNTTSSMGRLTLNVLLSFAQFEREVIGERIRDKIAASKRKGLWMGGVVPLGYLPKGRTLVIDEPHATQVQEIYRLYLRTGCARRTKQELDRRGWATPERKTRRGDPAGNRPFSRGHLYRILGNPLYIGQIAQKGKVFPGEHPPIIDSALWQAVQERLAANRQGRRTHGTTVEPSLLAGLVFDATGNRLTPSHATKGPKRYRYYLGPAGSKDEGAGAVLRIPARELEEVVIQAVAGFLVDQTKVMASLEPVDAGIANQVLLAAKNLAEQLRKPGFDAATRMDALHRLVKRVSVRNEEVQIAVRVDSIASSELRPVEGEPILLSVPVRLKRCGLGVRLIVAAHGGHSVRPPDAKLVALVRRGRDWFDRLASGRCDSVAAIAREEGLSGSHVTRMMYAAFLAPDIVDRILRGDHPPELGAHRLLKQMPLPLCWKTQRELLGMTS